MLQTSELFHERHHCFPLKSGWKVGLGAFGFLTVVWAADCAFVKFEEIIFYVYGN